MASQWAQDSLPLVNMERLFPRASASQCNGLDDGAEHDANQVVERKFHDTLEEVFVLKQILQEFLSEPAATRRVDDERGKPIRQLQHDYQQSELQSESNPAQETHQMRTSRGSERLLRQSVHFEPNFQARVRHYMTKTQRKKAQLQAELDEKTRIELKLKPAINHVGEQNTRYGLVYAIDTDTLDTSFLSQRSKRIQRGVHHLHAWNNEKELKLQELREAESRRELKETTSRPRVSQVSRRLNTNRVDDLAQCKVEDRLHLLGLIYEYQQEERVIEAAELAAGTSVKPQLAPHSSRLVRDHKASVHERLHEQSKQRARHHQPEQLSPRRVKPKEMVEAAIQRLEEAGAMYRKNRQDMALQREQQFKYMQAEQKLSSKSRKLAEKARSKGTSCEHHRKCEWCHKPEQDGGEAVSTVDSTRAAAIYERHVQWKANKEQRYQEERERREAEEVASFEFRNPHYRSAWDSLTTLDGESMPLRKDSRCQGASPGGMSQRRQPNHAFFDKSTRWANEREENLSRERQIWNQIYLRDCTFKPSLCPPRVQHSERVEPSPAALGVSLDRGFFSRTNLRTPMLGADGSRVSTDDCVDGNESSSSSGSESESESSARSMSPVGFFDHGQRVE